MLELVLPEEHFDEAQVQYNQKLVGVEYVPREPMDSQELKNWEGGAEQAFVAGFDVRDDHLYVQKPFGAADNQAGPQMINGVNASLFDFDVLQENLDSQQPVSPASPQKAVPVSKKGKELIVNRQTIR